VVQKNTHEALITEEQAEAILAGLNTKSAKRATPATYLLTGVLETADGQAWHGDGTGVYYRLSKGKKVRCDELDNLVLKKISNDLSSPAFISRVTKAVKATLKPGAPENNEKTIRAEFQSITKKIDSLAAMLVETSAPAAILRQIEKYEIERSTLEARLENIEHQAAQAKVINLLTEKDVRNAIEHNIESMETLNREDLKELLRKLVEAVTLDPINLTCSINYRISIDRGVKLASPRDCKQ
jgi:hypothetical protein